MCVQEEDCFGVSIAHCRVRYETTEAGDYCLLIQKHCIDIFVLWRHCHSNRQVCTSFALCEYCVGLTTSICCSRGQCVLKSLSVSVQEYGDY